MLQLSPSFLYLFPVSLFYHISSQSQPPFSRVPASQTPNLSIMLRRASRRVSNPQSEPPQTRPRSFSQPFLNRGRRASEPATNFVQHTENQLLPLPKPYVNVRVLDFVTVPEGRLSAPRNALGPVDLVRRPPAYDLITNSSRPLSTQPVNQQKFNQCVLYGEPYPPPRSSVGVQAAVIPSTESSPKLKNYGVDHGRNRVFVMEDRSYAERLVNIVSSTCRSTASVSHLSLPKTDPEPGAPHQYESPYSDHSSDTISTDDAAAARYTDYFQETYTSSTLLSTSSLHDSLLSDIFSSYSMQATTGTSHSTTTSSTSHSPSQSQILCPVRHPNTPERKRTLPTFMRKKVPSPVKYTFRPMLNASCTKTHPDRPDTNSLTAFRLHSFPPLNSNLQHSSFTSTESNPDNTHSTQSPTLGAIKKLVDTIDPRLVLSMASPPPLSLPSVSLFRRKRASDETRSSRSTSRTNSRSSTIDLPTSKRPSMESRSSNTEYYEDDYTRFIEKKPMSPMSLRLRSPHIARMICHDSWQMRSSQEVHGSHSSLSLSTSDEEYVPVSPTAGS